MSLKFLDHVSNYRNETLKNAHASYFIAQVMSYKVLSYREDKFLRRNFKPRESTIYYSDILDYKNCIFVIHYRVKKLFPRKTRGGGSFSFPLYPTLA